MAEEAPRIAPNEAPGIAPEKVCFVIVTVRELDSQMIGDDPDEPRTTPHDLGEGEDDGGEDFAHDSTYHELKSFIGSLNEDEQASLVALMWLGRGEYGADEWDDAVEEAARVHNNVTADYLIDTPLLADYLDEGLSQFDISCEDFDLGRL